MSKAQAQTVYGGVHLCKKTPDLLSLSPDLICLWNISTNPTNLSSNLAEFLYFEIFFKKLHLLYIGTEGVYI
jgi:hypothetical protein